MGHLPASLAWQRSGARQLTGLQPLPLFLRKAPGTDPEAAQATGGWAVADPAQATGGRALSPGNRQAASSPLPHWAPPTLQPSLSPHQASGSPSEKICELIRNHPKNLPSHLFFS